MKKTYINPSTKVCEIKYSSSLLTGSLGYEGTTESTSGNLFRDDDFILDDDWKKLMY